MMGEMCSLYFIKIVQAVLFGKKTLLVYILNVLQQSVNKCCYFINRTHRKSHWRSFKSPTFSTESRHSNNSLQVTILQGFDKSNFLH